jgi:pimeloyl-ACP methyl ester carboxylesterase
MHAPTAIASHYFSAPDGLRLHALAAGPRDADRLPAVCLPGLARTAEDFRELIEALAFDRKRPRRVLALDARGRGKSAHDPDPTNYAVPVELGDVLALLDSQGIGRAVFIGTSRGGILTMAMGAARPRAVAGAILNDIGPAIEMAGLLRIKSYVGRLPQPRDFAEAVEILRAVMGNQFPAWDDATWDLYARRTWEETEHGLVARYDPALSQALADLDPGRAGAGPVAAVRRPRPRPHHGTTRRAFRHSFRRRRSPPCARGARICRRSRSRARATRRS